MFKLLKTSFSSAKPGSGVAVLEDAQERARVTRQEVAALFAHELAYKSYSLRTT